jgi:hypothetical protein
MAARDTVIVPAMVIEAGMAMATSEVATTVAMQAAAFTAMEAVVAMVVVEAVIMEVAVPMVAGDPTAVIGNCRKVI